MKRFRPLVITATIATVVAMAVSVYAAVNFQVVPKTSDRGHTFLVNTTWLDGIGCPTNARVANPNADFTGISGTSPYTDPACPTGDPRDPHNQGLLLAKTGPTSNFAAAQAQLAGVEGVTLTELGYDIRKPGSTADPRGSHCGAGAPRFDIEMQDGSSFFLGCNSPTPVQTSNGSPGWLRLRWGAAGVVTAFNSSTGALEPVTGKVKAIYIVMDEGQDAGPDNFGLAVLDNVDVNGTLVGHGPNNRNGDDGDGGRDNDNHGKGKHNGKGNDDRDDD